MGFKRAERQSKREDCDAASGGLWVQPCCKLVILGQGGREEDGVGGGERETEREGGIIKIIPEPTNVLSYA